MKISLPKEGTSKEIPPLTLIPEETKFNYKDASKCGSFKLHSDPSDADSPKYTFNIQYVDGTQSIREHLQWVDKARRITKGLRITNAPAMVTLIEQLCQGPVKTTFTESISNQLTTVDYERREVARRGVVRGTMNDKEYATAQQQAADAILDSVATASRDRRSSSQ